MTKKIHKIKWTDKTKQDVNEVYDYYSENANTVVALKIVIRLCSGRRSSSEYLCRAKEPFLSHLKKEYLRLVIGQL